MLTINFVPFLYGRSPLLTREQEVCLSVCLCSSHIIGTNAAESIITITGFAPSMFSGNIISMGCGFMHFMFQTLQLPLLSIGYIDHN